LHKRELYTLDYLVNGLPGLSRQEAELRLRDDDLWVLIPEQRCVLQGEESVEQWHEASAWASWMAAGAEPDGPHNEAITQLLWDLAERAEEALRRAEARARRG
jgi:hypothetical protein